MVCGIHLFAFSTQYACWLYHHSVPGTALNLGTPMAHAPALGELTFQAREVDRKHVNKGFGYVLRREPYGVL